MTEFLLINVTRIKFICGWNETNIKIHTNLIIKYAENNIDTFGRSVGYALLKSVETSLVFILSCYFIVASEEFREMVPVCVCVCMCVFVCSCVCEGWLNRLITRCSWLHYQHDESMLHSFSMKLVNLFVLRARALACACISVSRTGEYKHKNISSQTNWL